MGQETKWAEERRGLVKAVGGGGVRGHGGAMAEMDNTEGELPKPAWVVAALRGL